MLPWISVNNINISHLSSLIAKRAGWLSFIVSQMGYEDHEAKWLSVALDDRWQSCGQNSQLLILCSPLSPPHVQPLTWPPLMLCPERAIFLLSHAKVHAFEKPTSLKSSSHSLISCQVLVLEEGLLFALMLTLCRFSLAFFPLPTH